MRKLLIVFLAAGLLTTACNNKKDSGRDRDRDRKAQDKTDDYGDEDEDKKTDREDADTKSDYKTTSADWGSAEKDAFLTNCISSAQQGGTLTQAVATKYCNCMLDYLIDRYPNPLDAGSMSMDDPQMKEKAMDCLK